MTYNEVMLDKALSWMVNHIGQAKKAIKDISKHLSKGASASYVLLLAELRMLGPNRNNWPNFTKMRNKKDDDYHCHIEKGRPTYVVCWKAFKKDKIIEVYYVGTHEKAPY
jgi:hypothetical protein